MGEAFHDRSQNVQTEEFTAFTLAIPKALATTDQPIGLLLRDNGVQVTRELQRWGHLPAGRQAGRLGEGLTPTSRVPARTYLMRLSSTGKPLALLTERFAPHVFR